MFEGSILGTMLGEKRRISVIRGCLAGLCEVLGFSLTGMGALEWGWLTSEVM